MNNYKDIGERLREYAIKRHFSVANLERILEMKPKSLSQYISGRNKPGPKLLNELSSLGCDIEWLLTGQEKANDKELTEMLKYKNLFEERLSKLEITVRDLKADNYDLRKELDKKNAELLEYTKSIEMLFDELDKNNLLTAQLQEMRERLRLSYFGRAPSI